MEHRYKHPVALVTGGNRGIGFEVCRALAQRGLRVILTGRDKSEIMHAQAVLKTEGLLVDAIELDVTDERMIRPPSDPAVKESFIADWIRRKYGRLDVLVNNAGVVPDTGGFAEASKSILDTEKAIFERGLSTHFYGPLFLIQGCLPLMREGSYGRIVNVSTGMARLTEMNSGWPSYRVSKVALNTLTRILADELKGSNILVNAASPGWVKTRMGGEAAPLSPVDGADTIVWLATLPDGGPSGGFFTQREQTAW